MKLSPTNLFVFCFRYFVNQIRIYNFIVLESKVESPHKILTRDKTKSTTLQFGRKMRKHSEFSSSSDSDSDDCLFDKVFKIYGSIALYLTNHSNQSQFI